MAKRRRKRIVVDRKLQLKLSMSVTGILYFYLVLFALLANSGAIWTVLTGGDSDQEYVAAVSRMQMFLQMFVLPLGITFLCMALHGFLFSHRVAGPIGRMKDALRSIASGNLDADLKLRKDDYFHDLCGEVNTMVGGLREELVRFRKLSLELANEGESLAEAGDLPDEAQQKLLAIANASAKMRQLAEGYKISLDPEASPSSPVEEMAETA
ncbi:MAG: HAMP domain-containing protein [Planctomycetota bacterium]|jgi:methyl-accepting chemotaxis protein